MIAQMDVGVGSFVFSLGLVSVKAFPSTSSKDSSGLTPGGLLGSMKRSIPILVLGLIRVMMVKGTDYPVRPLGQPTVAASPLNTGNQEHVTEYGVHWNFFFTLGLLPFLGQLAWPLRRRGVGWSVLGLGLSAGAS